MLQFVLGLSDRQAAEAVRCRIDFKYAMALELDDPGFHHSVLADFRDRLTEGNRADRLLDLDLALARLEEAGLVRERTTRAPTPPTCWPRSATCPGWRWPPRRSAPRWRKWSALPRTCWTSWSTRAGDADTDARSGWARAPRSPRPEFLPPAMTPSGSWNTSTGTERTVRRALVSRLCARSWCRTITATPRAACAGAPPRPKKDPGCRPRPGRSSPPTTPRPAMPATATSSTGRGSPPI
ncbi:transposase [Streptomyces sp. NPDC013178]|uniref:transposase n=1 Tax=Streptomyces sp. NPDC013178 TaxID=3155118 RepID=UPI00340928E4